MEGKKEGRKPKVKPRAAREIPLSLPTGSEPTHPNAAAASVFTGITKNEELMTREELLEVIKHERDERSVLTGEFQRFKNAAEVREAQLEDEIEASVVEVLKGENSKDELTETLSFLRTELSNFKEREEELIQTNASSMSLVIGKENELRNAATRLEKERRLRLMENAALEKRITMLEHLRQSLVPGITSETDSTYWNFCISIRGIASHEKAFNPNICNRGGLTMLIRLCNSSKSPEVILAAASAIAELSVDGRSRRKVLALGGIKPLCSLLNDACEAEGRGTATLAEQQMISLVAFAVSRLAIDPLIRAELARVGAISPLAELCRHSKNKITLHACCMALSNMSFENAANKARIVGGGAVQAIVRILAEETESAVVFEAAKCLSNITCDCIQGQQEVAKSGGIQAMVFLLGKKSLSTTTMRATLGALANVALNISMGKPTVVASAGLMPMIRFLSKRKTHPDVVSQAAKALGNTAFGSQSVKARIMAEKAGPPLVARLIAAAAAAASQRTGFNANNNGSPTTTKQDPAALSLSVTTQLCKAMTSLCLNRDNGRLFCTFGILEPICELCDCAHELAIRVQPLGQYFTDDNSNKGKKKSDESSSSDGEDEEDEANKDPNESKKSGYKGAPYTSTTPRLDPSIGLVEAVDARAALLASLCLNDEVRDIAVERLDAAKSMTRVAIAYLEAHQFDRSSPTKPFPVQPPYPVSPNMLPPPEELAKHPGLPAWLKLGLMKYASRSKIDRDELFYCSDLVRQNGEFFADFTCYSEYFSNANVTLISGSSELQATR
jgi:hypothetical protein